MMMIEITIISSSRVKPADFELRIADCGLKRKSALLESEIRKSKFEIALPVTVLLSIQGRRGRLGVNVKDINVVPRTLVRRLVARAKIPLSFSRDGIDWNRTQVNFLLRS